MIKLNQPEDSTIKALIIYDDFISAAKANVALQRSAHHPDMSVKWNIHPWRVDMLKFPPTAELALTEAIDVHLIVFAGLTSQPLASWLQNWLEHWAKCRRFDEAAWAIIHDRSDNATSPSARSELSRLAECHGLDFIAGDFTAAETKLSLSVDSVREHKLPLLPIQPGIVNGPASDSYRNLGIND